MSTFPDAVADGRRSNFTHTCNLLSQFLKEKRLGMSGKTDSRATTMDLLNNLRNSDVPSVKHSSLRPLAQETPQLTIFYAGKLLVFDAFPPQKATEVMELATKLGSGSDNLNLPQSNTAKEVPPSPQAFGSDMRYPRRTSLLKFLEKRKERVIARGPYQMNNPKQEGSASAADP